MTVSRDGRVGIRALVDAVDAMPVIKHLEPKGFACPVCHANTHVTDSRPLRNGELVRRRRECEGSDREAGGEHLFTTYEMAILHRPLGSRR